MVGQFACGDSEVIFLCRLWTPIILENCVKFKATWPNPAIFRRRLEFGFRPSVNGIYLRNENANLHFVKERLCFSS